MTQSAQQIEAFLQALRAERDAAQNTLQGYHRDIDAFEVYLSKRGASLLGASRSDLEAYLDHLRDAGLARATRARRLSALRQFFQFARSEGWRSDDPSDRMKGPGKAQAIPKTLSEAQVDALLAAAQRVGRAPADRLRNLAFVELLYATGLRVTELASLHLAAVQAGPRMILVRGKGGKERLVPLSDAARTAIEAWLPARAALKKAKANPGARYLFPSRGGDGYVSRVRFHQVLKDIAAEAGVSPKLVSPHVLRHAFATHLLANGADLRVIQMLLGHANVATTEIYTHILDERLKTLVNEHHPLANKG